MIVRPVILVGGSGTRLWPQSREKFPKQFIPTFKDYSLFDLTIKRVIKIKNSAKPIIVTNSDYQFLVKDSLKKFSINADIILEPIGRNTSAAIYMSAKICDKNDEIVIFPSDHYIQKENTFLNDVNLVLKKKNKSDWVTFGIFPNKPSSAYGYMKIQNINKNKYLKKITKFVEKPSISLAQKFLNSKNYVWNSGIFFGNANQIIKSITEHAPEIAKTAEKAFKSIKHTKNTNVYQFKKQDFEKIPSLPIDISVMEKNHNIYCYPCNFIWSDIGSWDSYLENIANHENGNKIFQLDSYNNIIKSHNRIIATIDISDLIIVDTLDATLIAKKGSTEKVKDLIDILKKNNIREVKENKFENRPWGKFEILLETKGYKVKKITVNPNSRLSKQYHKFRSEHWTITKGKAKVFLDEKIFHLKKGNSIDIPRGSVHYIQNETEKTLEFVEIQMGTYFGEDDIFRLDDIYNRN
tara:strand:- start:181 stop:1578 length:1398 start_codon:yes stop_codon:yes gene_type:complete